MLENQIGLETVARSSASTVEVAFAIDSNPWSRFQRQLLALAALVFLVDGLANQALGLAIPALINAWGVPRESFSKVAAAGLIGVIVGTTVGGWCGDRLGRRPVLIASVPIFGLATALSALCTGPPGLLALRALAGVGLGGALPSGAALISEFTPADRRSLAIVLGMVFLPVGSLLSGIVAALVLPTLGWRGLFAITGALPLLLAYALFRRLPESPRFLARDPARSHELHALMQRCGYVRSAGTVFVDTQRAREPGRLRALFGRSVLVDTLSLWLAFFFNLLGSYTLFSWVPTLLSSEGYSAAAASLGIATLNVGGVLGGVAGGWFIGAYGSRRAVLVFAGGGLASGVTLALFVTGGSGTLAALIALGLEGAFIAALAAGLYTLVAFVYPPHVRATGVGAAVAFGRIGAVVSSYTGVSTLKAGGGQAYFLVVAAELTVASLALLAVRHHIPGTLTRTHGK